MTKHSFLISILILATVFAGCKPKSEFADAAATDEEYSSETSGKDVIITGKILNRDVYPNEKELILKVPFFFGAGEQHKAIIQDDSTFSFRFPVYGKIREVTISNYAEHLYVHPSDSIHLIIDFKDMLHPQVTGDAGELNQQILNFTEDGYYYVKKYTTDYSLDSIRFELALEKEFKSRMERRNEYIEKFKPNPDVALLTEELVKQDYYFTLLDYLARLQYKTNKSHQSYRSLLPEIEELYKKGVVSGRLFEIAEVWKSYIGGIVLLDYKKRPTIDTIMAMTGRNRINQYMYAGEVAGYLGMVKDTAVIGKNQQKYDSIVKISYLREQIDQLYQQTKAYVERPKQVSDFLLYGKSSDNAQPVVAIPHMKAIYDILKTHEGKVIYFDFWGTRCPPCLEEMEPLKKLRDKYPTDKLVIYSICVGSSKEEWKACLKKYSLENRGIECVHSSDYFGEEAYSKIAKQLQINSFPYFILIDSRGQIVDFGSGARPSNPQIIQRIESLIDRSK